MFSSRRNQNQSSRLLKSRHHFRLARENSRNPRIVLGLTSTFSLTALSRAACFLSSRPIVSSSVSHPRSTNRTVALLSTTPSRTITSISQSQINISSLQVPSQLCLTKNQTRLTKPSLHLLKSHRYYESRRHFLSSHQAIVSSRRSQVVPSSPLLSLSLSCTKSHHHLRLASPNSTAVVVSHRLSKLRDKSSSTTPQVAPPALFLVAYKIVPPFSSRCVKPYAYYRLVSLKVAPLLSFSLFFVAPSFAPHPTKSHRYFRLAVPSRATDIVSVPRVVATTFLSSRRTAPSFTFYPHCSLSTNLSPLLFSLTALSRAEPRRKYQSVSSNYTANCRFISASDAGFLFIAQNHATTFVSLHQVVPPLSSHSVRSHRFISSHQTATPICVTSPRRYVFSHHIKSRHHLRLIAPKPHHAITSHSSRCARPHHHLRLTSPNHVFIFLSPAKPPEFIASFP
jgi:hypothetical protein